MKILVIIALLVAVLAGAGSLYFVSQLGGQKTTLIAEKNDLTTKLQNTEATLTKTKGDLEASQTKVATMTGERDQALEKLNATVIQLNSEKERTEKLEGEKAELKKTLDDKNTELASAKETMENLQKAMGNVDVKGIEDVKNKVAALSTENELLGQNLAAMRGENVQLKQKVEELSVTPVGIRGKVAMVNDSWNFLVLDLGREQRIQPNTEFLVYRDSKMVGKVKVVSVQQTTSVAELLPDYRRGIPRAGDLVVH